MKSKSLSFGMSLLELMVYIALLSCLLVIMFNLIGLIIEQQQFDAKAVYSVIDNTY